MVISSLNYNNQQQNSFKTYCIIGDPIEHSLSPIMHTSAFSYLRLNSSYIAFKVTEPELEDSVISLRRIKIAGFNVTIPHKVKIIEYLDKISAEAQKAGSVNTVKNENGKLIGFNTDIYGISEPLRNKIIEFDDIEILIMGAGGSCRAALVSFSENNTKKNGIKKIHIFNRNQERLNKVIELGRSLGLNCIPHDYNDMDILKEVSLKSKIILNTTSIGLKDERSPINPSFINKGSIVFDIIYRPIYTNLLKNAKNAFAIPIFGYEMLLYQGAKAFEIWTGLKAPIEIMKKSLLGIFGDPV